MEIGVRPKVYTLRRETVPVELACRAAGKNGRAVGMHDGGSGGAAAGNIRRIAREAQMHIPP